MLKLNYSDSIVAHAYQMETVTVDDFTACAHIVEALHADKVVLLMLMNRCYLLRPQLKAAQPIIITIPIFEQTDDIAVLTEEQHHTKSFVPKIKKRYVPKQCKPVVMRATKHKRWCNRNTANRWN